MGKRLLVIALALAFAVATVGADSCSTKTSDAGPAGEGSSKADKRAAKKRAQRRARARARQKAKARARARAKARAKARARRRPPKPVKPPPSTTASNCDPNYKGACLDPNASDYDCEGGSGDGPEYTGTVTVVGDDHFDLNRDSDNIACEP